MGWLGYSIYAGDGTQSAHVDFLLLTKCGTEDEIFENEWFGSKTKIPKDRIPLFEKNIDKVIKKMPKSKYWNEYSALEWQMLLALYVDNKIEVPITIKEKGIDASHYLCGDHAADFDNPSARRRCLKSFIKRAEQLPTKNPLQSDLLGAMVKPLKPKKPKKHK